jgi:hypothetical protein
MPGVSLQSWKPSAIVWVAELSGRGKEDENKPNLNADKPKLPLITTDYADQGHQIG